MIKKPIRTVLCTGAIFAFCSIVPMQTNALPAPRPANIPKIGLNDQSANQQILNGKVNDENSQPIAGVSVTLKGSSSGTRTDEKGNFQIAGVSENTILVFSYVGYQTQEVTAGAKI